MGDQTLGCPYLNRQKSLAASTFQCVLRNAHLGVRRLRAGDDSMPLRFNTLATVPRPTLWLRLANALEYGCIPLSGFSLPCARSTSKCAA